MAMYLAKKNSYITVPKWETNHIGEWWVSKFFQLPNPPFYTQLHARRIGTLQTPCAFPAIVRLYHQKALEGDCKTESGRQSWPLPVLHSIPDSITPATILHLGNSKWFQFIVLPTPIIPELVSLCPPRAFQHSGIWILPHGVRGTSNEQCPSLEVWVPAHRSPTFDFLKQHPGRQPLPRVPLLWGSLSMGSLPQASMLFPLFPQP